MIEVFLFWGAYAHDRWGGKGVAIAIAISLTLRLAGFIWADEMERFAFAMGDFSARVIDGETE
jgi:hypothetical protein